MMYVKVDLETLATLADRFDEAESLLRHLLVAYEQDRDRQKIWTLSDLRCDFGMVKRFLDQE